MNPGQRGISTINRTGWTHGRANTEILLHTLEVMLHSRAAGNIECWSNELRRGNKNAINGRIHVLEAKETDKNVF